MVDYRRNRVPGGTFFFTVNLHNRRSTLLVDHVVELRDSFTAVRERHPFHIDAVVVLPEHLHAVWTLPEGDDDYALRWRLIKTRFTQSLIRSAETKVWQDRYWEHTIRDEPDFEAHVNYVHINPVKHGYVERASEWQHSSIHRYVREGTIATDWAAELSAGEFGE